VLAARPCPRRIQLLLSFRGQKMKRKYRDTPYSPQRSVWAPKRCPVTALGVLGKLCEPCTVRARPNPTDGRAALAGTETARVRRAHFSKRNVNT
jgi:hypothetical protein